MTNDLTAIRVKATDPRTTVAPVGTATVLSLCDEVERLRAENGRLVETANQARMAFAGYVSTQSAINKLDEALAALGQEGVRGAS